MLINAVSFVGTTAVTSLLGFAYWWVAARWFPAQAVGLGSAMISAMKLLGTVCIVGLGTLLVVELPRQPGKEGSLISVALIVVAGVGGGAGMVFAVVAPFIAPDFHTLGAPMADVVLFASGVSLAAMTFVLDQALIGLLQGGLQFWRNALFSATKLAALLAASLWLAHTAGVTMYATWALGNALSLAALACYALLKRGKFSSAYWPQWGLLRKLQPQALQHYMLNVVLQAPTLALPVLVTVLLSATTNAWFSIAWIIVGCAFVVPTAISAAAYTGNAGRPAERARTIRLTALLALGASMLAVCVLLLGAKGVLGMFGPAYAEQAAPCLRILSLGCLPVLLKYHYAAVSRMQGRVARATLPLLAGSLLELGAAALGAHLGGLCGLSLGWVAAVSLEAACLSPALYKAVRLRQPPSTEQMRAPTQQRGTSWSGYTAALGRARIEK